MKPYVVQLEISGPIALWARPDTLPNPVSYVAPTFSAVKGIFEAILRWKSVNVRPSRCGRRGLHPEAPVQFHRYAFNYGGPLRKSGQIKDGMSLQIFAQALINDCYRLHAEVDWNRGPKGEPAESPDGHCACLRATHRQTPHVLSLARRTGEGVRRTGEGKRWQEQNSNSTSARPDYVGPFRDGSAPCATENHVLPTRLRLVFYGAEQLSHN